MQRSYRIDIETNSTIIPEATDDKQNMNEALQALSGFIKEALPVVQSGLLPFDGFKSILLKITRQFQFGEDIQDELKSMQAPQPPAPPVDNSVQLKQMELQAKQAELQATQAAEQAKLAQDKEIAQAKAMLDVNFKKMDQLDVQGQAMLDVNLEKMRLENEKYLAILQLESAQTIKRMEIDAARYLEELRIANAPMPMEGQIVDPIEPDEPQEPHPAIMEALNNLTGTHDQTNMLLAAMNRPKRIIRGEDGNIEGVE
jgi:hypothetical protein